MSRGKYAQRAARRREIHEAEASIESYKHAVKRLTTENRELRERLAARDKAYASDVRRLKAERDEGLSPMVTVLQEENARLKEKTDKAQRERKKTQELWERACERMIGHYQNVHAMTRVRAFESVTWLIDDEIREKGVRLRHPDVHRSASPEAAERIAVVKGLK